MATGSVKSHVKVMNAEEVRRSLSGVLSDVAAGQDIIIERYARKVGVVIRYEDYVALQEELEDLRDARLAEQVYAAVKSGKMKTIPWRKLREELRAQNDAQE